MMKMESTILRIDIKLFNDHMNALLRGEKVEIPQFNFLTGRKEYNGDYIQLGEEDILVIEGIHCLNDELSYALPVESKFKIYISALTQLNVDEHNRVATTDGRLIRRMARDYRHFQCGSRLEKVKKRISFHFRKKQMLCLIRLWHMSYVY